MIRKIQFSLFSIICSVSIISCADPINQNVISLQNINKFYIGMTDIKFTIENSDPILTNKITYKDGNIYQYMLFNRRKSNFQGTYTLVIALFKDGKLYNLNEYEHFLKSDDELLNYIGELSIAEYLKVVK
jgi:hypothetical protein